MRFNQKGLTLIELVVAMGIGLIVLGIIYSTYNTQQGSHTNEQLVVDMQQNARAALALMKREIRMVGYNPILTDGIDNDLDMAPADGDIDNSGQEWIWMLSPDLPGIHLAGNTEIQFSMDIVGWLKPTDCFDGEDNNGDGPIDDWKECYNGRTTDDNEFVDYNLQGTILKRDTPLDMTNSGTLAYDIDAVAFAYAFDTDGDGLLDTYDGTPNGNVIWAFDSDGDAQLDTHLDTDENGFINEADTAGGEVLPAGPVAISQIRAVQIWILARTRKPLRNYLDARTYVVGSEHVVRSDSYKRCLLNGMVYCRNMGT